MEDLVVTRLWMAGVIAERNGLADNFGAAKLYEEVPDDAEKIATKSTKPTRKGRPISFVSFCRPIPLVSFHSL